MMTEQAIFSMSLKVDEEYQVRLSIELNSFPRDYLPPTTECK